MTNEEFLKDVCPNHTDKSKWNKSELLHILELHKEQLLLTDVSKSLPIGNVEILLKGLEHIGIWGDDEEEKWEDPGDCALDTLYKYRISMGK